MPVALITGASAGFGRALAGTLAEQGWQLIIDARNADRLAMVAAALPDDSLIRAVAGDVADAAHRAELASLVAELPGLDLLVNNASTLGEAPLPRLADARLDELTQAYQVNLVGPLALIQLLLPALRRASGTVVNISSDAAVADYPGWGGYGSSKAALDHLTRTFAAEEPELHWYSFDPGDMRTAMHQAAFPGEDISDRPEPDSVVPRLLQLLRTMPASGRYQASQFDADQAAGTAPAGEPAATATPAGEPAAAATPAATAAPVTAQLQPTR